MLQRQAHFVGFSYWRSLNSWESRKCTLLQWEVEKQERGALFRFLFLRERFQLRIVVHLLALKR
jgi:hypothetical protein